MKGEERPAWQDPGSYARFLVIAVCGLALDLWSKHWAFASLGLGGRRIVLPHVLEFETVLNPGALFGLGGGQTMVFLVASLFALGLVYWMFIQSSSRRWLLHIALGGILAGALGNMIDRMTVQLTATRINGVYWEVVAEENGWHVLREYGALESPRTLRVNERPDRVGYVRDFIKIPTKWWGDRELWPWVFNVADMLLVGGVCILALFLVFEPRPAPERALGEEAVGDQVDIDEVGESTVG